MTFKEFKTIQLQRVKVWLWCRWLKANEHWIVELKNEWSQVSGKWNWYTFTLIYIYGEKSWHGYEFWFTLLGLGIYIRYNTDKSLELFKKWDKEMEEEFGEK